MTDEQFEKATNIKFDLELLKNLLKTSNANHRIGVVGADCDMQGCDYERRKTKQD